MKDLIGPIVILVVAVSVIAGGFVVHRWWNYNMPFGYEDQVQDTVCAMVKPEALREGACK